MPAPLPVTRAASPRAAPASFAVVARYRVFLSYSHADTKWARWLMHRLESYSVPKRLRGRTGPIGEVGRRIAPVFRDRDELPTTSDLGEAVRNALRESATLVVICSPASARSRWVQEEIVAFKRLHGERGVFAFIVSGEPKHAGATDDCFSPGLRTEIGPDGELSGGPAEVVAADARPESDGPKLAFVRLVAGLLGVGFDELRQRELQRRNRRLMVVSVGSAAGMALTLALAVTAWQARNDAQRRQGQAEDILTFMLDDFRPELKKLGRLSLLDRVSEKATAHFERLDLRDQTDAALRSQAKALTQIGEDRMAQGRYPEAARAFRTAYDRSAALAARHPESADLLFDRGQAEYWIGFVHWRRGELGGAGTWLTRYRDSAVALAAREGSTLRAQRELGYSHRSLAMLAAERGDLVAARTAWLAELDSLQRLRAAHPSDREIQLAMINTVSSLAKVAEREGNFPDAKHRSAEKAALLEAMMDADPGAADVRYQWSESAGSHAGLMAVTGDLTGAVDRLTRARRLIDELIAQDGANRRWLLAGQNIRLWQAMLARSAGNEAEAAASVQQARRATETLVEAVPKDRSFTATLMVAWRMEAELRHRAGRADATDAVKAAVALEEKLMAGDRKDDPTISVCAQTLIAAARIVAPHNPDGARRDCERAVELLRPRLAGSRDWRLLDPAVRALFLLGQTDESRALRQRLEAIGYRPVEPWPEATLFPVSRHP